jgi:hypothetical protein
VADRPLLGLAWSWLAEAGVLLPVSAALHGAAWLGLALVTRALWRRLIPAQAAFGLTAALLVTSTVVLEIQHVLINPVGMAVVGTGLVYLALLLLWPDDGEAAPGGRGARTLAAAAALLAAGLLSEYGPMSAVAAATLLAVRGLGAPGPSRRRHWRSAALLLATALVGYLLFSLITDPTARPTTRPAYILELPAARWMALPFVGLTRMWQGSLGELLGGAGHRRTVRPRRRARAQRGDGLRADLPRVVVDDQYRELGARHDRLRLVGHRCSLSAGVAVPVMASRARAGARAARPG